MAPPAARAAATQILLRTGNTTDAVAAARQLVRDAPQVVEHQVLLALALHRKGDRTTALETIERAAALAPKHMGAQLFLIDCTRDVRGAVQALTLAERILKERRFDPLAAIPIQLRRFYALASLRRWDAMERVVADVAAAIPAGDEAATRHVAWQWARLGEEARDAKAGAAAAIAFRAALALVDHPQLRAELARLGPDADFEREYAAAIADRELAPWVRTYLRHAIEGAPSPEAGLRATDELVGRFRRDTAAVIADWDALAAAYPAVAARLAKEWNRFRRSAASRTAAQRTAGREASITLGIVFFLIVGIGITAALRAPAPPPAPKPDDPLVRMIRSGGPRATDEVIASALTYTRTALIRRLAEEPKPTASEIALDPSERAILRGCTDAMIRDDVAVLNLPPAAAIAAIARITARRDKLRAAAAK